MNFQAEPDSWLSASSSDDESTSDDDNLLMLLLDSSSEDSAELLFSQRGGSCPGKKPNKDRQRLLYDQLLHNDYWGYNPAYDPEDFRKRFRIPIEMFDEIVTKIQTQDDYFIQKRDACQKKGLSTRQKVACALRMLATGTSAEQQDDKFRLAQSTGIETLHRFCTAIPAMYRSQALRSPTENDLKIILAENEALGFNGCIGSIDCMHWAWKNCPSGWAGMFKGKEGAPTVVLEATADSAGRFWHFFFGMPGSLNDINVLDRSPLLHDFINGRSPEVEYEVNGNRYSVPYWLADGIYPNHHCFIKAIQQPISRKEKTFSTLQESKRKDIERAFGMLQSRFHILTSPCKLWSRDAMISVMETCVIFHNMILDHHRLNSSESDNMASPEFQHSNQRFDIKACRGNLPDAEKLTRMTKIQSITSHQQLRKDLIEHLWNRVGAENR